jgi:hypothetical protein
MPAVWTYPWTLYEEGLGASLDALAARGVDAVVVAAHYHSVRAFQPRTGTFERRAGGCYFDPDPGEFGDTPIDPPVNEVADAADPLAEVADAAHDRGMDARAWVVCMHNSRLGAENPAFRTEDAFGTPHGHAFCPSHPEVQRYFADVAAAVAERGLDEVQLESPGFPTVFHGHDAVFGHDKRHVLPGETETRLFSQCFCEACTAGARDHGVDVAAARATVRELVETSFERPHVDPPSLATLVQEHDALGDLFDYRAAAVEDLLTAVGDCGVPLNGYVGPERWPAGVTPGVVESTLDRVCPLCYVSDPAAAREQLRTMQRAVDLPVDAGVTLDPDVIRRPETFDAVVSAVRGETDGRINVYHHSLATEAHLDWVAAAVE